MALCGWVQTRARYCIRAILRVPVLACASMTAPAASPAHSPHCGGSLVCVTAPTNGRPRKGALESARGSRSFTRQPRALSSVPASFSLCTCTQEQVWSAIRRRTRWVTSLGPCAHARTTQDPVRVYHGSLLAAALGPRCSNAHQSLHSTVTVGNDVIADGVSLLNVGSGMVWYGPYVQH